MKKDCLSNCKFRCGVKIDTKTQEEIFMDFYKLDTTGNIFSSAKLVFAHQRVLVRNQVEKRKVTPTFS